MCMFPISPPAQIKQAMSSTSWLGSFKISLYFNAVELRSLPSASGLAWHWRSLFIPQFLGPDFPLVLLAPESTVKPGDSASGVGEMARKEGPHVWQHHDCLRLWRHSFVKLLGKSLHVKATVTCLCVPLLKRLMRGAQALSRTSRVLVSEALIISKAS